MGKLARKIILILLRCVLGGILVYAGLIKAFAPAQFTVEIGNYRIVPAIVATGLALYLPWLEIFAGLTLIANRATRGGLLVLAMLLVVFICAVSSAWLRGLSISCGCFGAHLQTSNYSLLLLRDFALLAVATILIRTRNQSGP
ncbi:MAG: DoxX family membrane protein [Verrucomicrobiota bacterium]|nr:DoxX family membrane protein [Verrucomicrobiota bacterium]